MSMLGVRFSRRRAADLMLSGAATIAIDQRISRPSTPVGDEGIAQDWRAIGGDLRRAMGQARRGIKAA